MSDRTESISSPNAAVEHHAGRNLESPSQTEAKSPDAPIYARPFVWVNLAALGVLLATLAALAVQKQRPPVTVQMPSALAPKDVWDPNGIEDFAFTERSGRTVTKADLLGKPWAVCFVFTRCAGPCLQITGQMNKLQGWLKDADVRLVTITVDPDYDTPEVLQNYAKAFNADPERWLFLTGDKEKIYHLIINSFKMPVKEMTGEDRKPGWEVLHSTNILHVDARGRVVGKYNGAKDAEVASLRRALENSATRSARVESAEID
jgi:protein SCO1/2/putative membrane protein